MSFAFNLLLLTVPLHAERT